MDNIIILSSSPPPTFARSPTPVAYPSPLRKDASGQQSSAHEPQPRFEQGCMRRDGFTTARQILGPKSSAENVPVLSSTTGLPKFTVPSCKQSKDSHQIGSATRPSHMKTDQALVHTRSEDQKDSIVVKVLPSDVRRKKKTSDSGPLNIRKAPARRKDWTPEKPTAGQDGASTASTFGMRLTKSFGHVSQDAAVPSMYHSDDGVGNKRRKIETMGPPSIILPVSKQSGQNSKPTPKRRNRSPAKKALTITGLMTSNQNDNDQGHENATLMMQFLASTQARMQSDGNAETFESEIARKATKPKRSQPKSRLKSPKTSIRTLQEQDFIFASASQLAREDSPTLLRDTVEAIKNSEDDIPTDPVSTQQTCPTSVESTSSKNGVSRFLSRKNLWTAAHRDENNALLHRNDPFDDSRVRILLTGKDALVEQNVAIPDRTNNLENSLDLLNNLNKEIDAPCDIDSITTPPVASLTRRLPTTTKRSYSTGGKSPSSKRMKQVSQPPESTRHRQPSIDRVAKKTSIPPKPNYALWTDEALKAQVQEHGFKRIRARATMINKLDEYWAEKYGLDPAAVKAATKAATKTAKQPDHGHFLTNVHELAVRPSSKPRKPSAGRRNGESQPSASRRESRSKVVHIPENTTSFEDSIVDIDDIDNTNILDRLASINAFTDAHIDNLEPSTAPVKGTGVKATTKPKAKRKRKTKAPDLPLTPPPTLPPNQEAPSSPGFDSPRPASPEATTMNIVPEDDSPEARLKSQIRTALLHPAPDASRRNHQKNPTWHEKMLMYDPIVLEDFTAWLNTEGFNAIGVDDEIDAKDVKAWCEENGICCLWKGGWRGNKVKE